MRDNITLDLTYYPPPAKELHTDSIARKLEPGFDAEDEDALMLEEEEELLISALSKLVHYLIRTYPELYLTHLASLLPTLGEFSQSGLVGLRQIALCVYDDIIEFCGERGWTLREWFAGTVLQCILDPSPELRQAACYGIGVSASTSIYAPLYEPALASLFQLCAEPTSRNGDNIYATENAISAIAKICKHAGANEEIIRAWCKLLPVVEDLEECECVYGYFVEVCERGVWDDLEGIVGVCVGALGGGVVEGEVENGLVRVMRGALGRCSEEARNRCWEGLSEDQRKLFIEKQWI